MKGENFSVVIDHSALVYIINSKKEPPTLRLKKLLEILSQYSFNIRYLKGKEMYITDFLSRHPGNDTSSPNEIIPIAFIMKDFSEYIKEISPISTAFVMQTWSDYGEKRDQVCDLSDIECEAIEPREEHFDKNERCSEIKSINTEACKHVAFEILDIVYLILMHVGIVIFLYVLHKVTIWIAEMINKNYINKKACNSILCKAWNEQTDIYLQVAVKSCQTSLKCYLGTFLGAPSEIEINNLTDPIKISLIKGFIKDKIAIDWTINLTHQLKYTSITCEGEKFYLPD